MTIEYKPGVPEGELSLEASTALRKIDDAFGDVIRTRVTSTSDGKHMKGSKHYDVPCNAFDMSIWPMLEWMRGMMAETLGSDYDVVLEYDYPVHFHIEYDPK